MTQPTSHPPANRPAVAIVNNSHTPYRAHLHLRIVRELPQIRLLSVYTHERSNAPWKFAAPAEINPVSFGQGESSSDQARPGTLISDWKKGGRMIEWIRRENIRGVVMGGYNDPCRLRVIQWLHKHHIPAWLFGDSNIRGDAATGAKSALKRMMVSRVIKRMTGCFACGTLGRDYFVKYGAAPECVYFFPYEPDYSMIQSISRDQVASACERFALDSARRRIVYSGRLVDVKRVDLLVDAFLTIAPRRAMWDLLIIGDGPDRAALQARIPPELRNRVTWTGFLDDQQTISALYRGSDLLVLPSDFEPWAVVINEAAAAGMAIIASDVVGAAAELVRDGVNGRAFPAGDLRKLTEALFEVTASDKIESIKAASAEVLADWRRRGDPVEGLRKALVDARIITGSADAGV